MLYVCRHGRYTIIVQCKYRDRNPNASIDITDVYELFGAMKHYELQHKSEIVSEAFWTTVKGNNCQKAHEAAKDLGIAFYEGVFIYQQQ
ncbi:MAG: hypothetical protein IJT58_03870 [Synergistaceae bacterium]|nr:hypothetical protein [Synergistaceae bacterium]